MLSIEWRILSHQRIRQQRSYRVHISPTRLKSSALIQIQSVHRVLHRALTMRVHRILQWFLYICQKAVFWSILSLFRLRLFVFRSKNNNCPINQLMLCIIVISTKLPWSKFSYFRNFSCRFCVKSYDISKILSGKAVKHNTKLDWNKNNASKARMCAC